MEKISQRTSHDPYAFNALPRAVVPAGSKPADQETSPASGTHGLVANDSGASIRSQDGDTFTLSRQARTLRDAERTAAAAGTTDTDSAGQAGWKAAGPVGPDRPSTEDGRRYGFPPLADAVDVAETLLSGINTARPAHGESKADFAESAKRKLRNWISGPAGNTEAYPGFRGQVAERLIAGLVSWAADGQDPDPDPGPEAPGG